MHICVFVEYKPNALYDADFGNYATPSRKEGSMLQSWEIALLNCFVHVQGHMQTTFPSHDNSNVLARREDLGITRLDIRRSSREG